MKRLFLLLLSLALLCACTTPPKLQAQTPAQIAAQVCPPLTGTLTALGALVLPLVAHNDLVIAQQVVDGVCSVQGAVTNTSLQAVISSALPALVAAVKASPLPVAQQNTIILDLSVAQIVVSGVIAAGGPAAVPPPAPAPAALAPKVSLSMTVVKDSP